MKAKIIYALILALSILALQLNAQSPDTDKIERLAENCVLALTHENSGVAESAIFLSIQFKNRYPNENSKKFVEVLDDIASESKSPRISYKAQLAKIYLVNKKWFDGVEIGSIESEQKVYEEISSKINQIMFASEF
jgi:hypothetical protein